MTQPALQIANVSKTFARGSKVLDTISLDVRRGEMVALIGASGSGKSTLIRTIAGLLPCDRGQSSSIMLGGAPMQVDGRIARDAAAIRSRVGVIFQQFNLVPRLSVLTNTCLGTLGRISRTRGTLGYFTRAEQQQAMQALARVGIAEQALKRGSQLSGGQQQRAAIARALVQNADLILADEPIASLDPSSARRVMDTLAELNRRDGMTVLVSLHQVEYALAYCPRTIALKRGAVVFDGPSEKLTPAFLTDLYGADGDALFFPGISAAPMHRAA
jgi:phosphonate transport system ATP-binding protein